jgi:hypothetical protein
MRVSELNQMSPGKKFFFARIFPLIFVVVGASLAFLGILRLVRAKASVDWPSTLGKVLESSVERPRSSESSSTAYHATILYEYSVEGTTFSGNRVAYGDYGSSNPSHARTIVSRYPKGKTVTVHYRPGTPEECLLEPGLKGQSWVLPGGGLLFFAAGILVAVHMQRQMRKQETPEHLLSETPLTRRSSASPLLREQSKGVRMTDVAEQIVTCVPEVTADKSHRPGAKYNLYVTDKRLILEFAGSMAHSPIGFFLTDFLTGKETNMERSADEIASTDKRNIIFPFDQIQSIKIKKSWLISFCQEGRGCVIDVFVGAKRQKYWITMETKTFHGMRHVLTEKLKEKVV